MSSRILLCCAFQASASFWPSGVLLWLQVSLGCLLRSCTDYGCLFVRNEAGTASYVSYRMSGLEQVAIRVSLWSFSGIT
ncbi:hypothetical protein VTN49DRAFT_6183 [Thermomyces lanuginosus]|uniref:uncharacterized protein n=1 Tax=Thermomyces lanuginosus TaxID=5541 RepID=UPI00374424FB